jgi:hypothetical protein
MDILANTREVNDKMGGRYSIKVTRMEVPTAMGKIDPQGSAGILQNFL